MKKLITILLVGLISISFSGCEVVTYKDELISVRSNITKSESGSYFLVWASYSKYKNLIYNYYHKSENGKIQLSYSDVYNVEIYEDVPNESPEYIIYTDTNVMYGGEISYPEFHVHKGSIQPVIELNVIK